MIVLDNRSFLNMSKNQILDAEAINDNVMFFIRKYTAFSSIMLSMFKWSLPEEYSNIDKEFIEKLLYYKGKCAIVKDKDKGFIVCDFNIVENSLNIFGEPTKIQGIDIYNNNKVIGTYTNTYSSDNKKENYEFVIIKNNAMWYPTNLTVWSYCNELANIREAVNININGQKFPIVLQGTKEQKLTLQNLTQAIERGDKYLFLDKNYNISDITTLNVACDLIAKELLDIGDKTENELLTLIGINNNNVNKQSGVSDFEVNANNDLVNINFNTLLYSRQKACELVKKVFDIDMSVDINTSIKEVEDNEPVFN